LGKPPAPADNLLVMRILLAAEESAGARALAAAQKSGHEILGVLTSAPENTVGREAARWRIPVLPATLLKDPAFADQVRLLRADVLLNVHSLYLVKPAVLESFAYGCFNLHPAPLPDYAGMNAPSWAILHGESRHGVTLHWMTAGIDEGFIAYQRCFDLTPKDTGFSVSMRCIALGLELLGELLETLLVNPAEVPRQPQDFSRRRYFGKQRPHDGRVHPSMTALALDRFVRASDYSPFASPWGHPALTLNGQEASLISLRLTGEPVASPAGTVQIVDQEAWLATADEWVALKRVAVAGKPADPITLVHR
jgi:methionyl-tRNA formyltransferase